MIDPRYMSWNSWCSAFISDDNIPLDPVSEDNWKDWARRLIEDFEFEAPDPLYFVDWQDWAVALQQGLE